MKKNVTSKDVAKAAGVSQSLVSLILNNVPDKKIKPETRELVMEASRKLKYQVNVNARNMKNRKAGSIGLLSEWDTHSFVFPPVIQGVQAVCTENGLSVMICTGRKSETEQADYIDYFLQNRIDGLIYVSYVGVTQDGVIRQLMDHKIPFVCIIGARDLPGVSCVDVSFLESGYLAAKHLAAKRYRRIAYICGTNLKNAVYGEKERFEGCCRAASELGMEVHLKEDFTTAEAEMMAAAKQLIISREFDSVISTSYTCFVILKAAAILGIKVPEGLGVISLDNELYAPYLYPSLTTIDEPLYDIAKRAMSILLEKMNGKSICEKVELPPLISIREST